MVYRRTERVASRLVAAREGILAAAEHRVALDGWSRLTIARVAQDAGVAVGTVYRHLEDKDALCAEVFARAAGRELDAVRSAAHRQERPLPAVEEALRTFASRALRRPRLAYALLAEPATPTVEDQRLQLRRGYCALFERLIEEGVEAGDLEGCHVPTVAAVLVGAVGEGLVGPLAPARTAAAGAHRVVVDELLACCRRALPTPRPAPPHDLAQPTA
jgi:AcrR family transcriptional regulator